MNEDDDTMKKEEETITVLMENTKKLAKKLSLDLDNREEAELMMKCMAVCLVSIGAQVGKETFAIDGIVYGGNRERCDTYEFTFKSSLKHRDLAN